MSCRNPYWNYFGSRHWDWWANHRQPTVENNSNLAARQVVQADSQWGEGGSEVVSVSDGLIFVTNGARERIDVFDQGTGKPTGTISLMTIPQFNGIQSVSVKNGLVAVAVDIADGSSGPQNGLVALFDAVTLAPIREIQVGNLPDQVSFSADGSKIFVANEGEPDGPDAPGSISVIDLATGDAQTFGFEAFDDQVEVLRAAGVRIFPDKLPSLDFEPEYIAEDAANGKLYVSLQEANAIAEFDLATKSFTKIIALGAKDHSLDGNGLDFNDKDGEINITTVPVKGLFMPDAIAVASVEGQTYLLTANEGDDRGDFQEVSDAASVGDVLDGVVPGARFDPRLVEEIETLAAEGKDLSRLNISIIDGDTDGDGDIDELFSYGARSFSIFDLDGNLIFDSGDDFEQIIAAKRVPNAFNNDGFPSGDADVVDETRSDNKGPEPEAIATGVVGGKTLAFIGLERDSGVMIYDISDPANSKFVQYIDSAADGNISPEVIQFIPADESETGKASIAVSYEVSGTTAIYELEFGKTITDAYHRSSTLEGGIGDDVIRGLNGNDTLVGLEGDDLLKGGSGHDRLYGGDGDDTLNGGWGYDRLYGGAGDDKLKGGSGRDRLDGGAGDDHLSGGRGRDTIILGSGDDTATGGRGRDVFVFEAGIGTATITDFSRWDSLKFHGVSLSSVEAADDDVTLTLSDGGKVILEDAGFGNHLPYWLDADVIA